MYSQNMEMSATDLLWFSSPLSHGKYYITLTEVMMRLQYANAIKRTISSIFSFTRLIQRV